MKVLARIRSKRKIFIRPRLLSFAELLICDRLGIKVETYLQYRKDSR
jgi:hypothetical protein